MIPFKCRRPSEKPEALSAAWTWSRCAVFLALSAYLLFAHGCHDEGDHELFAPAARALNVLK